ncbi:isocitrate dehydrogenase subunit 1 [Colletotrichum lupini]|uniref:Isocitrate dehydrogenase [NAD] subunit 1, mitochondrial n=1 Tax=Colletotrichum lupini TaxID=145971 RepID=A0A9Q8WJQ3_9PEZI|nr:isocitrate dehydrogenase subunit 1 [Colletotrichum lupini]UQC86183.1 isocitrate dehydrogenase subunit 1 [Colletotrichum lupini]
MSKDRARPNKVATSQIRPGRPKTDLAVSQKEWRADVDRKRPLKSTHEATYEHSLRGQHPRLNREEEGTETLRPKKVGCPTFGSFPSRVTELLHWLNIEAGAGTAQSLFPADVALHSSDRPEKNKAGLMVSSSHSDNWKRQRIGDQPLTESPWCPTCAGVGEKERKARRPAEKEQEQKKKSLPQSVSATFGLYFDRVPFPVTVPVCRRGTLLLRHLTASNSAFLEFHSFSEFFHSPTPPIPNNIYCSANTLTRHQRPSRCFPEDPPALRSRDVVFFLILRTAQPARAYATVGSDIFKPTKFGGKYTVTLIPGDGIGAEVAESVKTIFKADNVPIEWEQVEVSGLNTTTPEKTEDLFRESVASLRRNKLGLKGILHTPIERSGHQSFNVAMRQELDIYASISLIKNIPGYQTRHEGVDLAIIRENTEGEYSGLEHQSVPGVVESLKIITRAKSERIAKFAFNFALANNRKKVTCIHKANIMKLADGLFRSTFHRVANDYPTLEVNDMIVDNASMQAVSKPQQFDVMVMPNLYGGILSNIGAALVGGAGIVPGCNMGRDVAVFEPGCRHVGLDIKGKDQANPTALILSGAMLLRHLGLDDHANRISQAIYGVIAEGQVRTRDMGGEATTHQFTKAILDKMDTL